MENYEDLTWVMTVILWKKCNFVVDDCIVITKGSVKCVN